MIFNESELKLDRSVSDSVDFILNSLHAINTLLLDVSSPSALHIASKAAEFDVQVIPFEFLSSPNNVSSFSSVQKHPVGPPDAKFFSNFIDGETRCVFGLTLNKALDCGDDLISFRVVTRDGATLSRRAVLPLRPRRILHLTGSSTSEYYRGLSAYYCFEAVSSLQPHRSRFVHSIAYVHLDGTWSVEKATETNLNDEHWLQNAKRHPMHKALAYITDEVKPDVVQSHLFDYNGLTSFRELFAGVLNIPVLGCSGNALALSTHKARTLAIASASGVPTAPSQIIRKNKPFEMSDIMAPPFVIKPAEEDNSLGVTFVNIDATEKDIDVAIQHAFELGDEIIIEKYVPLGREVRVAVTESACGQITLFPVLEYMLQDKNQHIRKSEDKVSTDKKGTPQKLANTMEKRLPADNIEDTLMSKLEHLAKTAHVALGCTDYSIYDVRIDPEGNPVMLESCLYCSFAPTSVLITMAKAKNVSQLKMFENCVEWALLRRILSQNFKQKDGENNIKSQQTGMKVRL